MERHRNATDAFRSFDIKGKGKVKKSNFIQGFERLRIRLSANDIEQIWATIDLNKKGFIQFNDFCILQEIKTSERADPFSMKAIETRI